MNIDCGACVLRPYREADADRVAEVANDWDVARFMTDRFPHPYTRQDAESWIHAQSPEDSLHWAIEVDGRLAGGIGLETFPGERHATMEIGYWLGRYAWGAGVATAAVRTLTAYALDELGVRRLQAHVFAPNRASARVLEKCEYVREGVLRQAVVKAGDVYDVILFARLRS